MKKDMSKEVVTDLLRLGGITVNGEQPWDIQIHNEQIYKRLLREVDLGLGESYMEGWWDCKRIDLFIERMIEANLYYKIKGDFKLMLKFFLAKFLNFQTKKHLDQIKKHYECGNDLFQLMLDSTMSYTCGYWKNATELEQAQLAKLDLVCKKILLEPGMRVLDIGCGWGGFAKYAAEKYDVEVVGITISEQQYSLAKERCANLSVEIRLQDYRDLNEKFDRIVSIGMFEHIGHLNYRNYMQIAHNCLKDNGIFLLHTIGANISSTKAAEWISKYIFPNGVIPSIMQIGKSTEKLFVMEDWHNFGFDYYQTLMAWHHNFNQNWHTIKDKYDTQFFRMWNFYLLSCAAEFKARELQLWQIVLSKTGLKFRYEAPR